jgi:F-type H+-transporting ATPase subunit b
MLIDWFTVAAQALNFIVLIWLMKRFLYRPILDAIDAREARVVAELQAGRAAQESAEQERKALDAQRKAFDAERDTLVSAARDEALALREELLTTARADADALRTNRASVLEREVAERRAELATRMRDTVFGVTRKVLGELADTTLEVQLVSRFARQVATQPEAERETLRGAFIASTSSNGNVARVRSAFALEPAQRETVRESVVTLLGQQPEIVFEVDPSLVVGIELDIADHTVGWSMSGYVDTLERAVADSPTSLA